MISAVLKILLIIAVLFAVGFWIHRLCEWNGKKPCLPEDCESCPFPPCKEKPIKDERMIYND